MDSGRGFRKAGQLLVTRPAVKPPLALPNPTGKTRKAEKSVRLQSAGRPPLLGWDAAAGSFLFIYLFFYCAEMTRRAHIKSTMELLCSKYYP